MKEKISKKNIAGIAICTFGIFTLAITAGSSVASSTETQKYSTTVEVSEDRLKTRSAITNDEQESSEEPVSRTYSVEDIEQNEKEEWGNDIEIPSSAACAEW